MNILSDETNLLRSHYYLTRRKTSEYAIELQSNQGSSVFIHKETRSFTDGIRITHSNIHSVLKVLSFTYLGLRVLNLTELLARGTGRLFIPKDVVRLTQPYQLPLLKPNNIPDLDNTYEGHTYDISVEDVKDTGIWPCGTPVINSDNLITEISLAGFVNYVNSVFQANIGVLFQNPIQITFIDMSYNITMYKIIQDIQKFIFSVVPTVYDYLISEKVFHLIQQ